MNDEKASHLILNNFLEFVVNKNLIKKSEIEATIDESVGSYIVNTIKQFYEEYEIHKIWLDNKAANENFELDSFVEVIEAYLNGFNTLKSSEIIKWLIELKNNIDELEKMDKEPPKTNKATNAECSNEEIINREDKMCKSEKSSIENSDPNIKLLSEIFPDLELMRIKDVYQQTSKNYEKAVELLLDEKPGASFALKQDSDDLGTLTEEEKKLLKERTVQK